MKDYSLKSGERYATLDHNLIGGDHLWRYRYAAARIRQVHPTAPYGADVFCGSGYGAKILAEETQGCVLAIDGSSEAVACANQKIHHPGVLYAAKLFPFQLPTAAFDFVASMESLEHVKDYEAFFWVLAQSLKPGGQLFISAPDENTMPYTGYVWHYKHFTPEEIRTLARESQLEEVGAFSTSCQIFKDGKARMPYHYQIANDQPSAIGEGDTLFFEFRKPKP